MASVKLGNSTTNAERWEHTTFNTRLQPVEIGLGSTSTTSNLLKLEYQYGLLVNGTLDTTQNNGNVQSQRISVPGMAQPMIQTYEYDALNRLSQARETYNNGTQSWQQVYGYDRYGNRSFANGTTLPAVLDAQTNPSVNPANNRFNAGQGYVYDNGVSNSAGNLTGAPGYTYSYDAENRIATSNYASPNQQVTPNSYDYDGDGRRVKKVTASETTVFVYNVMGQMVAEYNNLASQTENQTSYLTADTLGTPRVITKADGSVKSRHDYLPFGEEITGVIGGRNSVPEYGAADGVKQKFTGKEHDAETGLDYFGARYYADNYGRFTSTDPIIIKSDRLLDPQRLNLYVYVRNSPLVYFDPDGRDLQKGAKFSERLQKALVEIAKHSKGRALLERLDKMSAKIELNDGRAEDDKGKEQYGSGFSRGRASAKNGDIIGEIVVRINYARADQDRKLQGAVDVKPPKDDAEQAGHELVHIVRKADKLEPLSTNKEDEENEKAVTDEIDRILQSPEDAKKGAKEFVEEKLKPNEKKEEEKPKEQEP